MVHKGHQNEGSADDVPDFTGQALSRYSTSGEDAKWTAPSCPSPAIPQPLARVIMAFRPWQEELVWCWGHEPQMSLLSVSPDTRALGESVQEKLLHIL